MPELPEVETVARELRSELTGKVISDVEVLWERTVDRPAVATFRADLTGAKVVDVGRRGKFISFHLDTAQTLLVHLRMTGQLLLQPISEDPEVVAGQPIVSHTRVVFQLDEGRRLVFSDTRKFGRMYLVDDPQEVLGDLGPEPLEEAFTPQALAGMLAKRRGRIKPLLLNQSFLAGLGNIYADEALWRARIHPLQGANTLTPPAIARLYESIVSVLRQAIADGGTSLRDNQYRQPDGRTGTHQELLSVYGRAGQACYRCDTLIERIVVGQRGTHLCPNCQRLHA